MNRRTVLKGGLMLAVSSHTAVATAVPVDTLSDAVTAGAATSAQERFDFHLAELKKAAEELDPMIDHWGLIDPDDNSTRGIVIVSHRRTGEYLGDGVYEYAKPSVTGVVSKYEVRLRPDRFDGERAFDVRNSMEQRVLTETCLRTFIGRKIGGL